VFHGAELGVSANLTLSGQRFDFLVRPFARLLSAVRSLRRPRRRVWLLEGREASSGEPLSVLCAARGQTRNYLTQLLFGEDAQEHEIGPVWLWNLSRAGWARKRGCALIVIEADPFIRELLKEDDWFFIPLWLIGTAALPIPDSLLKGKSLRSEVRAIRKGGLQGRVTREPESFDDFYHNMYVPHVTRAHGSSVYVNPYDTMRARLADSDLVLIHDGERDIAGMMIVYDEDRPRLWSVGVRDGDRDYLQRGALAAVYHFCFQYLAKRHFSSVSLGLSRAFLNDGILRYKKKWAQQLVGTAATRIALKLAAETPASKSFLQNNPFIFETMGKLYGAVFLADDAPVTADTAARLKKQYFHDGLSKLILFSPYAGDTPHGLELPTDVALEFRKWPRSSITV
jgi:hypothetical protein